MKKILVLSSAESASNKEINEQFIAQIQALAGDDYTISWRMLGDVSFTISDSIEAFLLPEQRPIQEFDFVYFKSYYRYSEIAVALVEYLSAQKIPYICSELSEYISFSKLSQYARMAKAGIRLPKTQFVARKHLADSYTLLSGNLNVPFVLKAIEGKGGDLNFLVDSEDTFRQSLQSAGAEQLVAQAFVANDGDMRILVLGNEIRLVIARRRQDESTHLNNTSQGGSAEELDVQSLSEETRSMAVLAAQVMKREIAGVDIMLERGSGQPYLLEINASPQVASGALTDRKIQIYHDYFKQKMA